MTGRMLRETEEKQKTVKNSFHIAYGDSRFMELTMVIRPSSNSSVHNWVDDVS